MIIEYPNGDTYEGTMVDGIIDVRGTLNKKSIQVLYQGEFKQGVYHGEGEYTSGPYKYKGQFENNQPTVFPNQMSFKNLKVEEPEDPKAKKAPPPKKGKDEEEEDPNPNKLKF